MAMSPALVASPEVGPDSPEGLITPTLLKFGHSEPSIEPVDKNTVERIIKKFYALKELLSVENCYEQ
jgi:hypothetical protein